MSNRDVVSAEHIVWQDPPPQATERRYWSKWALVAEQLRTNQDRWAKLPTETQKDPRAFASSIKYGTAKAWRPRGAFQAVVDGDDVYARYVGEDGAP